MFGISNLFVLWFSCVLCQQFVVAILHWLRLLFAYESYRVPWIFPTDFRIIVVKICKETKKPTATVSKWSDQIRGYLANHQSQKPKRSKEPKRHEQLKHVETETPHSWRETCPSSFKVKTWSTANPNTCGSAIVQTLLSISEVFTFQEQRLMNSDALETFQLGPGRPPQLESGHAQTALNIEALRHAATSATSATSACKTTRWWNLNFRKLRAVQSSCQANKWMKPLIGWMMAVSFTLPLAVHADLSCWANEVQTKSQRHTVLVAWTFAMAEDASSAALDSCFMREHPFSHNKGTHSTC